MNLDWKSWRKALASTVALISLSIAAIFATQPTVDRPSLPIVACGSSQWVSTNEYRTIIGVYEIVVPPGFKTDLGSIPKKAQELLGISRDAPSISRGAYCHDYLYHTKQFTREKADWLLYNACLEDGMNEKKARCVYEWVRAYGFIAWERNTP